MGDQATFSPQISEQGILSVGDGQWTWSGPNNFMATTREINFASISENELGVYNLSYSDAFGCMTLMELEVVCLDTDEDGNCDVADACVDSDIVLSEPHLENADFKTTATIESTTNITASLVVNYEAGQSILLKDGFYAPSGATFTATINDCAATPNAPNVALPNEDAQLSSSRTAQRKNVSFTAAPNPFNDLVNIHYTLETATSVQIFISDIRGKVVARLMDKEAHEKGVYAVTWQKPNGQAPGLLFLVCVSEDGFEVKKLVVE